MARSRKAQEQIRLKWELTQAQMERRHPAQAPGFKETVSRISAAVREFYDTRDGLDADPELTDVGKGRGLKRAYAAMQRELSDLRQEHVVNARGVRDSRMARLLKRGEVQRPTDPAERLAYELRLREIRDELRQLDPLERDLLALTATDPMVLDAIETAPPVLAPGRANTPRTLAPFVDPERVTFARIERARSQAPEEAETLELISELAESYDSFIQTALNVVADEVPGVAADPVADAAAGR